MKNLLVISVLLVTLANTANLVNIANTLNQEGVQVSQQKKPHDTVRRGSGRREMV